MNENAKVFIYRPEKYEGPIAINATPSKEMIEYHKNSCIQVNMNDKTYFIKEGKICP